MGENVGMFPFIFLCGQIEGRISLCLLTCECLLEVSNIRVSLLTAVLIMAQTEIFVKLTIFSI